jgi:hypothetical protein
MKQPEKSNDDIPSGVTDANKQRRIQRLDKAIDYYGSKKHVATIILGIVFGAVELRYGVQYNGQCPIQPMIVIFMIVHGAVLLFDVVIGILAFLTSRVIYTRYDQVVARRLVFVLFLIIVLVNIFCFAWYIAGNVWVFGAANNGYQGSDNTNLTTYCEPDLFRAAIGIIISRYIIFGIIIIVIIFRKRHKIMERCKEQKVPAADDKGQM